MIKEKQEPHPRGIQLSVWGLYGDQAWLSSITKAKE